MRSSEGSDAISVFSWVEKTRICQVSYSILNKFSLFPIAIMDSMSLLLKFYMKTTRNLKPSPTKN